MGMPLKASRACWLISSTFVVACAACSSRSSPSAVTNTSSTITKDGGRLHLEWVDLEIARNAVTAPLTLTALLQPATSAAKAKGLISDLLTLGPSNIAFHSAVTLTMRVPREPKPGERLIIAEWLPRESSFRPLRTTTPGPGVRSAQLAHFSSYGIVVPASCCRSEHQPPDDLDFLYECCEDKNSLSGNSVCVHLGTNTNCSFGCQGCTAPEICCSYAGLGFPAYHCIDVKANDNKNCGSCGLNCADNTQGKADCCSGVCVNLASDPRNCGSCGTTCASNECCVSGKCEACPQLSFRGLILECTVGESCPTFARIEYQGHVCGDPVTTKWTINAIASAGDCKHIFRQPGQQVVVECFKAGSDRESRALDASRSTGGWICTYGDDPTPKTTIHLFFGRSSTSCREGKEVVATVDVEKSGSCD